MIYGGVMIYSGILINCGGSGDDGFDGGDIVDRGPISIENTDRPSLFRTERYFVKSYWVEVGDGFYDVHLGWAETYGGIGRKGQRVFAVSVNGSLPVQIDPFADSGGRNRAYVRVWRDVEARDEQGIDIRFAGKDPMINFIEVTRPGVLVP